MSKESCRTPHLTPANDVDAELRGDVLHLLFGGVVVMQLQEEVADSVFPRLRQVPIVFLGDLLEQRMGQGKGGMLHAGADWSKHLKMQ